VALYRDPHGRPLRCCEFDPSGSLLAVGSNAASLALLGLPAPLLAPSGGADFTLPVVHEWTSLHSGSVYSTSWEAAAALDADDWGRFCSPGAATLPPPPTRLATASNDTTACVMGWSFRLGDTVGGGAVRPLRGEPDGGVQRVSPGCGTLRCVCFAEPGVMVVGGGKSDFALRVWDASSSSREPAAVLEGHSATVHALARCGGDGSVVSASEDGSVRLWDVHSAAGGSRLVMASLPEGATCVAYDPRSRLVAAGAGDGTVVLADLRCGGRAEVARARVHDGSVRGVSFSPEGSVLATVSFDGTCSLLGVGGREGGKARMLQPLLQPAARLHRDRVLCVHFHPWAPLLATTSADGSLRVSRVSWQ